MHSHLIPGIDDGVKTNEEAFDAIEQLMSLGYKKIITTPHIMTDYYGNTAESVSNAYQQFLPALTARGISTPFAKKVATTCSPSKPVGPVIAIILKRIIQ